MKRLMITILACGALAACSSAPKPGTPEAYVYAEKKKTEMLEEEVEAVIDETPDWCHEPPTSDNALYACGIGQSQNVNMARIRAELEAKRQLASRIGGKVSSQIKEFQESVGDAANEQVVQQLSVVTKSISTEVDLSGYQTKESELVANGAKYMSFILLEYPIGAVNRIVVEKVRQNEVLNTRLAAADAFKELEAEIAAARAGVKE